MDRLAPLAATLLQKDVRLIVDLADGAGGAVLDAADAALRLIGHR